MTRKWTAPRVVRRWFRISVALAMASSCALAADAPTLAPVLVTGSHLPQTETPVAQSVIVITDREIRSRAPARFTDLLRAVPTLHVDQTGAPGGFAALYLRGADPNHTLVLIDGVRVGDPTNVRGGGIDLSLIDPRTVDRVEILPGASSAIYGADAMAGVVNIITRDPQSSGVRAGVGLGGGNYRNAWATGTLRSGSVGLRVQGATLQEGDASDDAFARLRTGTVKLTAGGRNDRYLDAFVRLQHQRTGAFPEDSGGPLFAARRALERRHTDGAVAGLTSGMRTSWGSVDVFLKHFEQDADIASPGVAPGFRDPAGLPRTVSASRYRRSAAGATAALRQGDRVPLLVGAQYEHEDGDVASTLFFGPFSLPANFSLERRTRSIFGETRLDLARDLSAHAGVRADATDAHGTRTTYSAGVRYRLGEAMPSVAVNYGTGFKPPSFFALGHPLVGNRQLVPEESRTVELSLASPEGARFGYRAAVFRSRFDNLIDFDPGPPPRLVNRSEVAISGYDVSLAARATDALDLRAGVTGLTFDLPRGVAALRNRPRLRATSGARYAFSSAASASVTASFAGRTFDSSVPTGPIYLGSSVTVDTALTYALQKARLVLAVDNFFDREYQQFVGFPAQGRRFRLELSLDL